MASTLNQHALMIDLGNSRLSWALYSGGSISTPKSVPHAADLPLTAAAEWGRMRHVPVYIANVAGNESQQKLSHWFETQWNISPSFLQAKRHAYGVTNAYKRVESLGVDRWLGMIGARTMSQLPVCIVDCGSAVTIDVMDAGGIHQGGLIIPGYQMMLTSLQQETAIPAFPGLGITPGILGRSTPECIHNGCANTIAAIIDRVMQSGSRLQRLIMTGGDAATVSGLLEHPFKLVPDLVFRGISRYITEDPDADEAEG
ncbi:MAG: type III pantothenate kinase [Pseudomonadota bacterium]